jgi:hypothetical protein
MSVTEGLGSSGQTKDYKIGMCCFSAKHAAVRKKSKDWLTQNQDNISEWYYMPTSGLQSNTMKYVSGLEIETVDTCTITILLTRIKVEAKWILKDIT